METDLSVTKFQPCSAITDVVDRFCPKLFPYSRKKIKLLCQSFGSLSKHTQTKR